MATSLFAYPLGVPVYRAFDASGNPLASGKLETYVAGTSTPLATYPTYSDALAGTNANANPVILDSAGAAQVWVQASFYKFILKDSSGTTLYTQDNVGAALGYPQPAITEWISETGTQTPVSATQFTVSGNLTTRYHTGRRIKSNNIGGVAYSTVVSSSFGGADTTVIVTNDNVVLDAGFGNLAYGIVSYTNDSYLDPRTVFTVKKNGNQALGAGSTKLTTWTAGVDKLSEWVAGSNWWAAKYGGDYLINVQAAFSNTAANIQHFLQICDSVGTVLTRAEMRSSATAGQIWTVNAHYAVSLSAGGIIAAYFQGDANTTVYGPATGDTRMSIIRIA